MATLTITSENAGIKFESEYFERVINGFTTSRDSGNKSLFINSNSGTTLEIVYASYASVTVDGVASTSINDLQDKLDDLSVGGISDVILKDSTGNEALIDSDGQLHVVQEGTIDTNNSTSTVLDADEVFTGTATGTLKFAVITVMVKSDKASATDGLEVEFSTDGTNWDSCDEYTIPAATGKTFSFQPQAQYYRVVYTNSSALQTYFRLQSIVKKTYVKPSSHRIQDSIISDDDAELVKAVVTGKNPGGTFVNFTSTTAGNFKTSLEELENTVSVNSNSQLRITPFDSLGNETIDNLTKALLVLDYEHHEIHGGSSYVAIDLRNVSTATFKWQVTTPDSLKYAHMVFDLDCTGEMTVLVTEGSDRTDGTAVPAINRCRLGTPTPATVIVTHTPTSGATDGTVTLMNHRSGATGVGSKTVAAGGVRGSNEFILKPATKYVISVTTYADVWVSLDIDWYEHTNKV